MTLPSHLPAAVIGAGQAGLAASYCLKQRGIDHVVLERARIGDGWASHRWDSFTLVTPNWTVRMPGAPYAGPDPDGYLPRDAIVAHLEAFARSFDLPVRTGVDVTSLAPRAGGGWALSTSQGPVEARNVIVATGAFPEPRILPASGTLSPRVQQLHTSQYRNPSALAPGGVLVVGSGQSGVQVAEELLDTGRPVWICVGSCHRAPRRYRGKDIIWWLDAIGFFEQRRADLPARARLACNPQVTGRDGGHSIDVWRLARRGAHLLGRFQAAHGERVEAGDDLLDSLATSEQTSRKVLADIDSHIARAGLDAPAADGDALDFALPPQERVTHLDLKGLGISTLIWATGFRPSYPWIQGCAFDPDGFPVTDRGVTASPGLFFLGVHLQDKRKSGLFLGIADDAAYIAGQVASRAGP